MAWIEVHQTLPSHRKIKALKRELKIKTPQAVGHMVMLWLWAIDNAPDGDLSSIDPDDIAEASEWPKSGSVFVEAMIHAGFLDENMQLHDWGEYAGLLMEKRDAKRANDRERQQRHRDKVRREAAASCDNSVSHAPVTRDNAVTSRTCHAPNNTLPYSTSYISPPPRAHAPAHEETHPAEGDPELAKVMTFYMDKINPTPSMTCIEELREFTKDMEADVIIAGISYAIDEKKGTWSYIRGTLRGYRGRGIHTMADLRRSEEEFERAKQRKEDTRARSNQKPGGQPADADPIKGFHTEL